MEKTVKDVHFNCPAELNKRMRVYAALEDTTVTALIIDAVEAYLENKAPHLSSHIPS